MHDALLVRRGKPARQLCTQVKHLSRGQGSADEFLLKTDAWNIFCDEEISFILAAEFINCGDIGMVYLGERQSFVAETLSRIFISQHAGRQFLQGDVALE